VGLGVASDSWLKKSSDRTTRSRVLMARLIDPCSFPFLLEKVIDLYGVYLLLG